jgi:hypothetical protein
VRRSYVAVAVIATVLLAGTAIILISAVLGGQSTGVGTPP